MNNKIICLSGWKGSGKDTVAEYLHKEYGYQKLSFAKALKDYVSMYYNLPRSYMDDGKEKERPLMQYPVIGTDSFSATIQELLKSELVSGYWTPRAILILEGSIKRAVHPNFWVSKIINHILTSRIPKVVITDMRYKSEADSVKSLFLHKADWSLDFWRISRHTSVDTLDPSERDLDNYRFDVRLSNNATPADLYKLVDLRIRGFQVIPGGNK